MKLNVDHLIEKGLVKKKPAGRGRWVLKYHNKVFYENLWHVDTLLCECRGTVVDDYNNVVALPFKKIFNPQEDPCPTVPDHQTVVVARKVNGFMCHVTRDGSGLIVGTTGTVDSHYAKLAREWVDRNPLFKEQCKIGRTYIFEVVDNSDPHIVAEEEGLWLIGVRDIVTGYTYREGTLDAIASIYGFKRPAHHKMVYKAVKDTLNVIRHEGWVVRDAVTQEPLTKCKGKHYLTKKFLMRNQKRVPELFSDNYRKHIDEEYYDLVEWLQSRVKGAHWASMKEIERRLILEEYFNERSCSYPWPAGGW